MNRLLAMVTGTRLLDDVLQAAAVAGCEVERVPDVPALRAHWHSAPAVVLDAKAAASCVHQALPRRPGVLLVSTGPPTPETWPPAVDLGVEQVIELPSGLRRLQEALSDLVEAPSGDGRVLSVLGGCGGAGASVLAAAVGQAVLSTGGRALLVDCDPLGGGLDLALGAEHEVGKRWPDLKLTGGRVPAAELRAALPTRNRGEGRLTFLSCSRNGPDPTAQTVAAVVDAGRRAGETVVCDVPRQLSPAAGAALDRSDLAVLVVPARLRACAAAKRVADQVTDRGITVHAVVRGPSPSGINAGQVAKAVGIPLLTTMRPQRHLATALDQGHFPTHWKGPLAAAAREVLAVLQAQKRLPPKAVRPMEPSHV
ncbi:secretion/DNA translocation related CpaE-like protein [Saccharothrix tamanrassetensis]|uniref:Secretion/DNA translocation related CpaE-like protein n=1 Tax=Saccharothrix tamanrassetensis TaxID=1051531 RepID=A0A841CIB2_9PSEU|nr:septum site-determining protein Ssd [Saccharothrix tamanrassetensis]MBB5956723.1 secretion/DNA translocation related CpaE-like protein [Saccharothrix tamanrassetensis]